MDLDGIGWLFSLLLQWRAALCLATSSGLAIVLVQSFTWLSGLQGIAIAALGLVPAAMWETSRTVPVREPGQALPPETSASVAALAALLAGAAWGAVSSGSMHSFMAGLAILLLASWGGSWLCGSMGQVVEKGRLRLCVALAWLVYPVAALVTHHLL